MHNLGLPRLFKSNVSSCHMKEKLITYVNHSKKVGKPQLEESTPS